MESLRLGVRQLKKVLDLVLNIVITVAVVLLFVDVLWGVYTRFVEGIPSRWTEEIARFLLMWVALLGTAVAFRSQEHLGFEYLTDQMAPGARRLTRVTAQLVTFIFVALVMVYGGVVLVAETLAAEQHTPALEMQMGYVYLALPISGVYILFYLLEQFVFGPEQEEILDDGHLPKQGKERA